MHWPCLLLSLPLFLPFSRSLLSKYRVQKINRTTTSREGREGRRNDSFALGRSLRDVETWIGTICSSWCPGSQTWPLKKEKIVWLWHITRSITRSNEFETMNIRLIEQEMPKCERAHRRPLQVMVDRRWNALTVQVLVADRHMDRFSFFFSSVCSCVVFYDIGDANVTRRASERSSSRKYGHWYRGGKSVEKITDLQTSISSCGNCPLNNRSSRFLFSNATTVT